MALICDIELENGLSVPDAYLRIVSFSGTETEVSFVLNAYLNKDALEEGRPPVASFGYNTNFDKDRNLFRQMYEHLRTLPEYENAVEA